VKEIRLGMGLNLQITCLFLGKWVVEVINQKGKIDKSRIPLLRNR
jgi:hypothetical protein